MSHTTSGHGTREDNTSTQGSKKPKAEDLKLQGSLKTFLLQASGKDAKLSKIELQKLQALLTTMSHSNDDTSNAASVDSRLKALEEQHLPKGQDLSNR
jgi:hypothetical protein